MSISIHAPPRGATTSARWSAERDLFQFTPLREGRPAILPTTRTPCTFQFTPLREGRRLSTTPLQGWNYFNSRPSARGDHSIDNLPSRGVFQFTPLREGRRIDTNGFRHQLYFNSRPSARGDDVGEWVFTIKHISIHAPPRGATCCQPLQSPPMHHFNSRPSARGDNSYELEANCKGISIHAPPRGATIIEQKYTFILIFQFTPLREGRLKHSKIRLHLTHFNSRPSARGDMRGVSTYIVKR